MNDDLIYRVADTFKTDLFLVGKEVRGLLQDHQFKVHGLWTLKSDITVVLDENGSKLVSAMAKVLGNLWVYTVVTSDSTWALFFDAQHVKLRVGAEKDFGLGNAQVTLKKLKPHITRVFCKQTGKPDGRTSQGWEPVELAAMDGLI
jgi:hypothetical protein